ncbi:MAG: hypothetical protein HND53_02275 [Proteobacteria bacterium]|nr:hypothetical protein [Pseudomonadota bacterium]NOG59297.1 hypothetical protein [Pseudomonadota bacterium]
MKQELIIFPVIALAALTFGVGIWLGILRFRTVKSGDVKPSYYKLNRGAKIPEYLLKVNNNYNNLLEIPVLFYIVSLLIYVTNNTDWLFLLLSWLFVVTRYIHSYIHTTYNNVIHRKNIFLLGVAILIFEWISLAFELI